MLKKLRNAANFALSVNPYEARVAFDLVHLPLWMAAGYVTRPDNVGQGRHVFVLPGFGASDTAMFPLRAYLMRHGFQAHGWDLGTNRAGLDLRLAADTPPWGLVPPEPYKGELGVALLAVKMQEKVEAFHAKTGQTVSLVGWSLGGTIAREVARDLPDMVDHVVTLGSPLLGGPKYTRAAPFLARRGLDLDWIEQAVLDRQQTPLKVPATAIYSPTDGIVGSEAYVIPGDTETHYIRIDVAHLSMGIHRKILQTVVSELADSVNP